MKTEIEQTISQFENDIITAHDLQLYAISQGWDEDDYLAMCEYNEEDDAWYPRLDLGAPTPYYSIIDHCCDWLLRDFEGGWTSHSPFHE